jgi:hypothetical protein
MSRKGIEPMYMGVGLGYGGWRVMQEGEGSEEHTRLIALAVFLQLAYEVLVLALPALTVLEVVFLEFG